VASIYDYDRRLGNLLLDGLERLGATVITPRDEHLRAGIVTARFPGHDYQRLALRLAAEQIYVSPRLDGLRYSVHYYNNEADVERALAVTEQMLRTPDRD
jgi:selenocysteine lyase/cysteine desulfurase